MHGERFKSSKYQTMKKLTQGYFFKQKRAMKQQLLSQKKQTCLFLIHALGQLEFFLPAWYMKIESDQFVEIDMSSDNLRRAMSEFFSSYILSPVVKHDIQI